MTDIKETYKNQEYAYNSAINMTFHEKQKLLEIKPESFEEYI